MIKNKVAKNAVWIIGCRIVQAVLALAINMLTARYFGPGNFGLINYAASIVAFVAPIMKLGINNVLVNEIIKYPDKEGETLGTSLLLTLFSSFVCIVGIVCFVSVVNPGETDTLIVCSLYSLLLIFQSMEMIQYWFQAKYLSKYTSITILVAYGVVSAYKIFLLATEKNIYWFAISNAFDYCLIAVGLLILYRAKGGQSLSFSFLAVKRLLAQGKHYIIPELMIAVFAQTDKIMLKLMGENDTVGYYSAAVSIAGLTAFVFTAIIDSMRPMILERKKEGSSKYEKGISLLYSMVIYLALAQSVFIAFLANPIIYILYGKSYMEAVDPLKIIIWYTAFSYIGAVRNVWILAEEKQRYLWIINLCGASANVLLNFVMIPVWGINGAAAASLITQIFTNVVVGFIMKPIRKNNLIMMEGLNPKFVIHQLKQFRRGTR